MNKNRLALAILILISAFAAMAALFFIEVPEKNRDLINFVLGGVIGWSGAVINHYFGDPDRRERTQ